MPRKTVKCSVCRKAIRVNQERVGTMHVKCWEELSGVPEHFAHQKETRKFLDGTPIAFDMSDAGTAKTRPAIEAWAARRRAGGGKALVFAVKSNLEVVWEDELRLWAPDMISSVAYADNRAEAFAHRCDVVITNTDATTWVQKQKPALLRGFDSLIVDESSYFKHRTTQRSKALAAIAPKFEFRELMSGTPNSNSVTDLWHQVYVLDRGKRLGANFFKFRTAVQTPNTIFVQGGRRVTTWSDKEHAHEAVIGMLHDIVIRHDFDECMDIPPNRVRRIKYRMPRKLEALYRKLEEDAIVQLEQDAVRGVNAATLRNKLLQMCSGAVYTQGEDYEVVDRGRYELIADLVAERPHTVVFFVWRHQRDLLAEEFERRGITYSYLDGTVTSKYRRTEIVRDFQAGKMQSLLLQPKTGAHGLTLTRGSAVVWASPIYEPDILRQGIRRIRRGGQTKRTETLCVEAERTVDQVVYKRLEVKDSRMMDLLNMIREVRGE